MLKEKNHPGSRRKGNERAALARGRRDERYERIQEGGLSHGGTEPTECRNVRPRPMVSRDVGATKQRKKRKKWWWVILSGISSIHRRWRRGLSLDGHSSASST